MKKLLYVFMVIIVAAFSFGKVYGAVLLDRVVATVNNEVITWGELMNVIAIEGKQYLEGVSDETKKQKMAELERPFLDNLIMIKLQLQEARKLGLDVSKSEIDGAVDEVKKKYNLTDSAFEKSLRTEGLTMDDYRTQLSDQILVQKVVNIAVRNNVVISDREIEEYFKANKDQYVEKDKLRIRQIFFAAPEDESRKRETDARAQEVFTKIQNGEDFAKLAAEFSEDASREFGGDLGYISRGSALKEVEDTAFALKKGEVSKPFWSPAGLHIIKLEDKIEGGGIEKVRDGIKGTLFKKAFEEKYREWKTGLRENAYVEIRL